MTNPHWRTSSKNGTIYRFPDDPTDYPSVTNLIGQLDKPALKYWAAKHVATAAVEQRGVWGDMPPEEAIAYLKATPFADASRKAEYGSLIHELIETGVESNLPRIAVAGVAVGDLFGEHYGSELTVVNREHGYAGTADVYVWLLDKRFCVADWKTGNIGYESHALQLGLLGLCSEYVTADGEWHELPTLPEAGLAIKLDEDGYQALELDLSELNRKRYELAAAGLWQLWNFRKWWGKDGRWADEYARRVK